MPSRIFLACLAIFVVLSGSARATNTPELTYPTGTRLATESTVKGSSIGEIKFTGSNGTVSCTAAAPTGTLTKNNGSEVEVSLNSFSITGTGGDGRCTGASSQTYVSFLKSCLRSTPEMTEDEFQIRGAGCSEGSSAITVNFTTPGECVYEHTGAITGSYVTGSDAVLTANSPSFSKVSGGFLCATAFKLDTSFTFETSESGNPLSFSEGPTLTASGAKLGTGAALKGHTVGEITLTDLSGNSLLRCSSGATTGTLQKNNGTEVEVNIESAAYSGTGTEEGCTSSFGATHWTFGSSTNGLPWCLRATSAMTSDEFQIRGNSCSGESRPIRISADTLVGAPVCSYERKAPIAGTYKTHPEDAILSLEHAVLLEKEPRSPACADETQMDGSLTLERDEAGTNPMYIS